MLKQAVDNVFDQLTDSIDQLTSHQYVQPCKNLSDSSVGRHVRHIIELFQCLEKGYDCGTIDYEKRKRDIDIETDKGLACNLLRQISDRLDRPNKNLLLSSSYDDHSTESIIIATNYYREIAYNLEHTIHHMALIRIGIAEISDIALSDDFGVASSTLKYRKQCVQ